MKSPLVHAVVMAGLWLALASIEVGSASAHTFYVATGGDDHHPGTRQQPFRHVGRGVGFAQPGDVVLVEDGVYHEQVHFSRNGTADAWIVLRPAHEVDVQQARPRVAISPGGGQGFNLAGHSYIRVEGFEIAGGSFGIVSSGATVGHHTVISNKLVHDTAASGIQLNDGDYRTITRNVVHHCARSWKGSGSGISIFTPRALDAAPGFHNVVARNICHDNSNPPGGTDGNGIILDYGKKNGYTAATLIENNLTYRNGGAGIHVFRSTNVTVRNNTSWWNRQLPTKWSWRGDLSNQESDDVVWANNIAWANPAAAPHNTALLDQPGGKNVIWRNNISYAGTPGKASFNRHGPAPAGNLLGVDPMLVDPPSDFRLRPGSPAIRAGTSAHGVPGHDLAGNRRSGPVDIGAHVAGAARHFAP